MQRIRTAARAAACIGTALLIASLPSGSVLGLVGAVALLTTGTVSCIETEGGK